jgi:hypothetical protein
MLVGSTWLVGDGIERARKERKKRGEIERKKERVKSNVSSRVNKSDNAPHSLVSIHKDIIIPLLHNHCLR